MLKNNAEINQDYGVTVNSGKRFNVDVSISVSQILNNIKKANSTLESLNKTQILFGDKYNKVGQSNYLYWDNDETKLYATYLSCDSAEFTQGSGVSPFTVTSITMVSNLNADLWDGHQFDDYLDQAVKTTSNVTHNELTLTGDALFTNKIAFTQTDLNEYIDSLADGYLDYSATTAHRFNMSIADTDVRFEFVGTTNTGLLEWMEDQDYFRLSDDLLVDLNEKINLRDTAIGICSQADGYGDMFADTAWRIGNSSSGSPTNYVQISSAGDMTFSGSAGFYPVRIAQSAQPTPDTGEIVIWRDTDDGKVYIVYNDTNSGIKQVELT